MRPDGRRVKATNSMYDLMPQFLVHRYDAMNMTTLDIPIEPMKRYIHQKRREGVPLSHLSLLIAAYVRTVAEFPYLNRFIGNKRLYAHTDLTVSMVVLRPGTEEDTMQKVYFDPTDDVFTVQEKMAAYITESRKSDEENPLDTVMRILKKVPFLLNPAGALLRFADRHGLIPKSLIAVSPFHASLLISNLANIRTNHIYHHVYEFGTTSVAVTMGNLREVPVRKKGEVVFERCMPLGVVMDERICSGHEYAFAFARFKEYLADPTKLEGPPKFELVKDV